MPTGYTPAPETGGSAPTVISAYDNTGTGYVSITGLGDFIITGLKNGTYHFDTTATLISDCAWKDNNGQYNHMDGFVDVEGRVSLTPQSPNGFTAVPTWDGAISGGRLTIVVSGGAAGLTGMISCVLA